MFAPRILITGTHSGSGKTTITTGIMGLLTKQGYNVNPFKVGPDYIDPSYHYAATGSFSRNLDCWMMSPNKVYELFTKAAAKDGVNIIEGVMGLFDGSSGISDEGSSAQVAKLTKTPVILVVDVKSTARSAAALVLGFQKFDPELNVAGVILNRVGSERHLDLVREAIDEYCGIPVVGYIRKNHLLELPSRHLGLIPTGEGGGLGDKVAALADIIGEGIDIPKLLEIAESAPEIEPPEKLELFPDPEGGKRVRIGIALDEAFSFYYRDALDMLQHQGGDLVPFSPIHDQVLPEKLDGLYIGGGYPEIYVEALSNNRSMLQSIKAFGEEGKPVYGECGGLMYLTQGITDTNGDFYPMVGLIPGKAIMKEKLVSLGYVTARCAKDTLLGPQAMTLKGHEFHYSELEGEIKEDDLAFEVVRNRSGKRVRVGYAKGNILASYIHIHFGTNIESAVNFVEKCRQGGRQDD